MQFDQKISNMIPRSHGQTRDSEQFMTEMKVKTPSLPVLSAVPSVNYGTPEAMAIAFAENRKAQMAARAMFELVHQFGDNLREGWKNVLDLLMHLLHSNLLPPKLLSLEDFVDLKGHISLKERFKRRQQAPKKEESGLFSWLGFTSSSGTGDADPKKPTEEEKELCKLAANVIAECHPENLIPDSRYLASSALTELINNIIQCSLAISPTTQHQSTAAPIQNKHENVHHHQQQHGPRQQHESQGSQSQDDDSIVDLCPSAAALLPVEQQNDPSLKNEGQKNVLGQTNSAGSQMSSNSLQEDHQQHGARQHFPQQIPTKLSIEEEESLAFLLELMVNIVLENRDRLAQVWTLVRDHLRWLISHFPQNEQLMERVVVSIIRIANRNLFRLVSSQQSQHQHVGISPNSPHLVGLNDGQKPTTKIAVTKPASTLVNTRSVIIVVDTDEDEQQTQQAPHQHSPPSSLPQQQLDHQTIQQKTMTHCADEVLQFMGQQLLALRPPQLFLLSRQIAFGLQILLRTNAANVHSTEHWAIFFTLLEAVGAAAYQNDDDIDFIESKQWILHPGTSITNRKSSQQSRIASHQTVQSEPEDIVASSSMLPQAVDERGYCSDDPSSMLLGGSGEGESRGGKSAGGPTTKRKPDNPLLVAAMEHRDEHKQQQEHLRLLNKGDSGEWIHVVPTTTTMMMPAAFGQQQPQHNLLQNIQEETMGTNIIPTLPNAVSSIQPLLAENVAASGQSPAPSFPQPQITSTTSSSPPPSSQIPSPPQQQGQPADTHLTAPPPPHPRAGVFKRGTIVLEPNLSRHDPAAFLKVVETLTFLTRDAAHITPANFTQFTHCLRMMVEASMDGGKCAPVQLPSISHPPAHSPQSQTSIASKEFPIPHENEKQQPKAKQQTATDLTTQPKEETAIIEQERLANCYMDASLQLLNICAQMHALSANIYRDWADAGGINANEDGGKIGTKSGGTTELWLNYWRPLLQSIARMACDCRRRIRASALEALGAAFRVTALGELMQPLDWEDCFAEVLFPLLTRLLFSNPPISPMDPIGMEEARIRAIQLSCKILLGHLTRISQLDTFADLLRRLFTQMDQFFGESAACSDLLAEVIQESLKNTVLVCESFGIFQGPLAGLHGEMTDRLAKLAQKHGAGLKMSF